MVSIGIICQPFPSPIGCLAALGRELQQRGHRVTMFNILDTEAKVLSEGLNFCAIGKSDYPLGSLAKLPFSIQEDRRRALMICRDAPSAIQNAEVEFLLVSQIEAVGGSVAEFLEIPYVTVCSALPHNTDFSVPPAFTSWNYQNNWQAKLRNRLGYYIAGWVTRPIQNAINQYRRQWKLPELKIFDDSFSELAQISQQPPGFDFPRQALPNCFHYTGCFRNSTPQIVPFPFDRLTEQPLIYASLGTLHRNKQNIFRCIANACEDMDVQLVISLGAGKITLDTNNYVKELKKLPGNPLVVEYAPQLDLLARAKLFITHAGHNSVMEALSQGLPMVAIPIEYDQPSVGVHLQWLGVAEVIPFKRLNVIRLREAVKRVLADNSYYQNAIKLQESNRRTGGVRRAADIVEQAITTNRPVLRSN